jgi:hypothetical protein
MEKRFRAIAAGGHETMPGSGRFADDARLARAAAEEFFRIGLPRVNVLVAGRDEVVRLVVRTILGHVSKPVRTLSPGEDLVVPPIGPGTLVIYEVGALALREQIQLLEWSGGALRNTQVISTTSAALIPRVTAGSFIDMLYYRLNTVYLDVTELEDPAA